MKRIWIFIFSCVSIYLIGSLIAASFIPTDWSGGGRFIVGAIYFALLVDLVNDLQDLE